MKNIREWKFPLAPYILVCLVLLVFGSFFDWGLRGEGRKKLAYLEFERVLIGQKEVGSLADPVVRGLAQSLIDSQNSNDPAAIARAEAYIHSAVDSTQDECIYVKANNPQARMLARREPGVVKKTTIQPWFPSWSFKKLLTMSISLLGLPLLLFYGLKGILRLKDKRRLKSLEAKYGSRYAEATKVKKYRLQGLEDEMTPTSLRKAENAGLVQTEPGEVQELTTLQETLAPGKASQST